MLEVRSSSQQNLVHSRADEAWRATNTYDIAISHNEGELYQF
jgi:hypothetical protein